MLDQRLRLARYFSLHTTLFLLLSFICYVQVFMAVLPTVPPPATGPAWIFPIVQFGNGTLLLCVGIAHGYAARCVVELRRRRFVIAVLCSNALWILTICLAPTGLMVLVLGFWFVFNREVRWAYDEVAKGHTVEEVLASPRPNFGDERDDYDDNVRQRPQP